MSDKRADLINQLAASMGAGNFAQTKYEGSRFDAKTGTLYCNGMIISSSIADKAIKHFTLLNNKCNIQNPAQKEMSMIYQYAIEAIKLAKAPHTT